MKKQLPILLCLFFTFEVFAQSNIDVLHYRYEIKLSDKTDSIYGTAVITVKFLADTKEVSFDLHNPQENGKGIFTNTVEENNFPLEFINYQNKISFKLFGIKKEGDTAAFLIKFSGIPADGLIISKNKYGKRTFFADNWPNRTHHWIPCVDNPADKASVEFLITAPEHYQVVSNGIKTEEIFLTDNKKLTHWKEETPLPTKVMVIGVAEFATDSVGAVNNIPVSSWVFPENKTEGFYDYAPAKDILSWYIDYIGPYAYKKLANIQSKTVYGGMENASAIFYHENSVTGNRDEIALLAHEIGHQWFGNHVTEKSYAHLWLSEGFATYLTHLYLESVYGTDSLNKRMQNDREEIIAFVRAARRPVVDGTTNFLSLLNANSYQKGGWVLHMLRRELGDSVFHKTIREYYFRYAGMNADTDDFRKVAESVSGKDLKTFFKQWLFTDENLSLEIRWTYDSKKKAVIIRISQKQSTVFNFPVTISLKNKEGKSSLHRFTIDKKNKSFTVPALKKPVALTADLNTSLLAEMSVQKY